jgi:hypothetical protein
MLAEKKPASGQDSFLEALHSEFIAGSENLNAWINQVYAQGAIDSLFGLETWLKGIRSFFSLDHLPLSELEKAGLVSRSFTPEIEIVRLAVQICEAHAYEVIRPDSAGEFEFDEFIEVQLRRDRILDFHVSRMLEQLTPRDSLTQLMDFLNDLRVTIDAVRDKPSLSYQFFLSLGRCFGRELKNCRYIDMLLSQRFRLQYDVVENQALTDVLREIPDEAVRRNVALTLLYLFRLLKYLRLISADLGRDLPLKQNLVLFSLIHREMGGLADFLEARFLKGKECGEELRSAAELIAYSQKIESQRVMSRELIFVAGEAEPSNVYTRIENTHGLLRNCCQSCVLTLLQAVDQDFDAASLFPSRARRLLSTERLRQDLWDLRQWLTDMLGNREELDANKIIERLTSFKEASLRDLMHRDWAEFDSFLDALIVSGSFIEIRTHMRKFVSFLEMLIQEISKRSVFQEKAAKS